MAIFKRRIVAPGTYTVRRKDGTKAREYVGPKRIEQWIATFDQMKKSGLKIPAPWRHEPTALPIRLDGDQRDIDSYNNGGFWEKLWKDSSGALWGEVDIPRQEDASKVGTTVQDVSLLAKPEWVDGAGVEYKDAITHIALVTHPVAHDDQNFTPADQSVAMSLSDALVFGADVSNSGSESNGEGPDGAINAGTANVKKIMELLKEVVDLHLPEDTSAENMLERLATALAALRGKKDADEEGAEQLREPPADSKSQPGPVAMSHEIDFALDLLGTAQILNPTTGKLFTKTEFQAAAKARKDKPTLQLSAEDQAAINWARGTVLKGYKSRLEACVSQGRVDPKTAQDFWTRLSADNDLSMSFDDKGEPVDNQYDWVMKQWERQPANSALTGHSPTSARNNRVANLFGTGVAFSLDTNVSEPEPPDFEGGVMSDDDVDKILAIQFQSSGLRDSDVEGGVAIR